MKTYSLTYPYSRASFLSPTAAATIGVVAAASLFFYAACVGLSIGASAALARASTRADAAAERIADFESRLARGTIAADAAVAEGFSAPLSFSYAMKRSLGRAPSLHEL